MNKIFYFILLVIIASCSVFQGSVVEPHIEKSKKTKELTHPMPKTYKPKSKSAYKRLSCNDCHEKKEMKFTHTAAKTSCLNCHFSHGTKTKNKNFLRANTAKLCTECHTPKNTHLNNLTIANHPINTKIGCINCHNPHGSNINENLIRHDYGQNTKSKGNLCAQCHWSKSHDTKMP